MRNAFTARGRLGALLAALAVVVLASSASQALATGPEPAAGTITGCYDAAGTLRVADVRAGRSCAPTETSVTWNAMAISAIRWISGNVVPLPRGAGERALVASHPDNRRLPAGSWIVGADVLIANGLEPPTSFRCWLQTRATRWNIGGQLQDWGGAGGWHRTLTVRGLVNLTEPDWVDVYCSHDQAVPSGGVFQAESVDLIAHKVDSVF
ncbi:hypothetical protein [Saccharothrix obliqua]|uniref:hypothetical protein n=1 Tax=Saccharothrix obliqua TaxID=2861747 RepID=UPI001C5EAD05|nr:hypothetical protein [Saccharothrix obliqua]MBW4722468.1 hypothetical protein [Saccharothrix obliqua]